LLLLKRHALIVLLLLGFLLLLDVNNLFMATWVKLH